MHAALRLLNERLNATLDDDEVPDGPGWGGSAIQPAGSNEVSSDQDGSVPYNERPTNLGLWTPDDNANLDKFNIKITADDSVQLGTLVKFKNEIIQVSKIKTLDKLKVFDCRRFNPHSALLRISPTTSEIYMSNPPQIRNYVPARPDEAIWSRGTGGGYHPKTPTTPAEERARQKFEDQFGKR